MKPPAAPSAPSARSGLSAIGSAGWWLAAGLYALAIFLLSSQSYPLGVKHLPFLVDKAIHVLVYGTFSAVLFAALRQSRPRTHPWVLSGLALALAMLYGLSDEYHQSFIPFRHTEAYDLAANAVGAVVAQGLVLWSGRMQ